MLFKILNVKMQALCLPNI